MTYMYI